MFSGYFEQLGLGVTAQNEVKCELALSLREEFPKYRAKNIYIALDLNSDTLTYYKAHRQGVQKDAKYQPVIEIMLKLQKRSGHKLGKRPMTALLRRLNVNLCVPVVRRLMLEHDVLPIRKRKLPPLNTFDKKEVTDMPDLVKRNFNPEDQGILLTTDVTQFNIGETPVYLSAFVDLFNNEIVSYGISNSPDLNLCFMSLEAALPFRNPEAEQVIHHSDNGYQYYHFAYKQLLADNNISQSTSRVGNCYDNGAMESVFGRIKDEMFDGYKYTSVASFAANLMAFIDYYNCERPQDSLGNLSPIEYRQQHAQYKLLKAGKLA